MRILLFVSLFWLVACGGAKHMSMMSSTSAVQGSVDGAGVQAFKSGFYQFAQTQNCAKCHGSLVSPKFASPDLAEAYSFARPLLDPANPNSSMIAVYAGNGHCADTPCSDPSNTATVQGLLASWAAAELNGGGNNSQGGVGPAVTPKYLTASLTLPATIAAYDAVATASTPLRFPLNAVTSPVGAAALPAKFNTAILEVEVRYTGPSQTHYRFTRMKIVATNQNGQSAVITGLHLYIKGAGAAGEPMEDAQQSAPWNNIGKPTPLSTPLLARPANLPATPINVAPFSSQSIIYPKIGPGDMVVIGFEELQ